MHSIVLQDSMNFNVLFQREERKKWRLQEMCIISNELQWWLSGKLPLATATKRPMEMYRIKSNQMKIMKKAFIICTNRNELLLILKIKMTKIDCTYSIVVCPGPLPPPLLFSIHSINSHFINSIDGPIHWYSIFILVLSQYFSLALQLNREWFNFFSFFKLIWYLILEIHLGSFHVTYVRGCGWVCVHACVSHRTENSFNKFCHLLLAVCILLWWRGYKVAVSVAIAPAAGGGVNWTQSTVHLIQSICIHAT